MAEKKIELKEIDPIDIFGVNDRIINRLGKYFPQLKITPRGNCIMLKGSYKDITNFEHSVNVLINTRKHKRNLNFDDVDQIFESPQSPLCMSDDFPMGISGEDDGECDNVDPHSRRGDLGDEEDIIVFGNEGKIIRARTKNQKKLVSDYYTHDLVFAIGPAGTGKTYTAIALAVRALKNREVKKLVLTRPAVEAGERLGFLPGDLKDKLDPYLQPLYDALLDMIPPQKLKILMEEGTIQIAPLAYMRGRTLEGAFVILDEAQNTSLGQLKMFLTRMGNNAKFIVTGDMTQIDLPRKEDSGLAKGIKLLQKIKGIAIVDFTKDDIVRHPLVTKIVEAFEKDEKKKKSDN
ncbi:MAG: PhoH family protein [Bacteroidales bacterium]